MNAMRNSFGRILGERGAAMVEFSVLMLAFVPLVLLPMYFQDAFRYKLDIQEAVCSTAWDFAFADYVEDEAKNYTGTIAASNQTIYNNLWSGNDDPEVHPAGPWADFTWVNQITCRVANADFGKDGYVMLATNYHDEFNQGGLISCTGQISVTNHYIPTMFLQNNDGGFAEQEFFEQARNDVPIPAPSFGIMVDPWTIHNPNPHDPEKCKGSSDTDDCNKEFFERANHMWTSPLTHIAVTLAWIAYVGKLLTEKISLSAVAFDNPAGLKMSTIHPVNKKRSPEQDLEVSDGQDQFYVTPFENGNGDKHKATYEARTKAYLGCSNFTGSNGNFGPDCQ